MTREIDFAAKGVTGSERFRPKSKENKAKRREKNKIYRQRYLEKNREKERARWREVAKRQRNSHRQKTRERNRDYYRRNREKVLAQKKEYNKRKGGAASVL